MHATYAQFDMTAVHTSWCAYDAVTRLRPIHDEADDDRTLSMMNTLLDAVGDDEDHDPHQSKSHGC